MATQKQIIAAVNKIKKAMGPEFTKDMNVRPASPGSKRVRVNRQVDVVDGSVEFVNPPAAGKIVAHVDGAWCGGWIIDFGGYGIGHVGHDEGSVIDD